MPNDNAVKIIVKFSCLVIFLLAFCFLLQTPAARAAAPTYFGSASNPADNGTGADNSTLAVTPPASMNAGDLVVFIGQLQASPPSGAMTISATGGQSWSSASIANANDQAFAVFWTQFNGTWSADPSISFPSETGTQPATAVMHVFRPASVGSGSWVSDTAFAGGAEASASPVVISGITPSKRDNVTLAGWAIPNVSTWGTLSGTGWVAMATAQWRNTSGSDQSATFAHQLQSTPAATNDVSQVPSGAAAGISFTMAWSFQFSPTVALNSPADASSDSDTTPTLNFTGTDANSDTLEYNVQVDTANSFDSQVAIVDSYDPNSDGSSIDTGLNFSSGISGVSKIGQAFTGNGGYITSVKFYLKRTLSPSGTLTSNIMNIIGTYGTSAIGDGIALATSNTVNAMDIPTGYSLVEFTFATPFLTVDGTYYLVGVNRPTVDSSNYITVGEDASSPAHDGNSAAFELGEWFPNSTRDGLFYVVGTAPILNKLSTTDSGFTVGHPFASGTAIDYTVQAGDALAAGTYYWRVKGIDPSGTNTYGAWSATRSFTITAGSPSRVIRLSGKVKFTGKVKVY